MTSAELLHEIVEDLKLGQDSDILTFHVLNPSTFYQGAFIFADGSIWWAR